MDIRKVKKLIEMLEASSLEEIEIQEGEESVRLVKKVRGRKLIQYTFIYKQYRSEQGIII